MGGGRSIQLARVFGIRIGVDPSWFIVLFLVIWALSGSYQDQFPDQDTKAFVLATASALLFFLSVILHELGHAVAAIRNGIGIAGIDLWLFGGLAKMRSAPRTPRVEFVVAAAGPLVTLLIAALCYGLGLLFFGDELARSFTFDEGETSAGASLLGWLAFVNIALLVFNLIPGYPLDGGRILRAAAWWRTGDRERATRLVARIGRGFGWFLMAFGAFSLLQGLDPIGAVWTLAIGFMLSQAARGAELETRISEQIGNLRVGDVMDAEPVMLPAETKLDRALDEFFLRYRWPWFPVVDATGRFLGLVSRQKVEDVPEALRPGSDVGSVMTLDESKIYRVGVDEPLEALLSSEGLQRLGAVMAVDPEGRLRGVVTIDQVRRALRPSPQTP
jgi:Zn-dependent protease